MLTLNSLTIQVRCARVAILAIVIFGAISTTAFAQAPIQAHLDAGEFPKAIELANALDPSIRDQWLGRISAAQMDSGATSGAYETAGMVGYDTTRASVLSQLAEKRLDGPNSANDGHQGGVTEADFTPLIDLIQGTIAPDSWQDTGQGLGTVQAYPAGVFVDADGTLKKIKANQSTRSAQLRAQAQLDSGNRHVIFKSEMRKVSLTRLEKAAQLLAAQGQPLDDEMLNLAGIYEIKYLMMYPETGDIVIAGPAGPWNRDDRNRAVNRETGKPVLQLDDLVVCLRNAWDNNGKFGCSITPRKQNLIDTKQFISTTNLTGKRWSEEIQKTLGKQDIEVFGIAPGTHTARVLVEADYRMKLLGMGLEPSIPDVPSYLDRIKLNPDGSVPPMDVVRWWFTLNYDDVVADEHRKTFSFHGTGVKVLSENEFISDQGDRIHTGQSNGPTAGFARDFTRHFDSLSQEYPIYRELKNVFDMALVASLIRHQDLSGKTKWHRTYFDSPDSSRLAYEVPTDRVANQVDSVLNDKILKFRKKSSTVRTHIVGVSGGISYNVHDVISRDFAPDVDGELGKNLKRSQPGENEVTWWWD
jgi:hypothetical protein